MHSVRAPYAHHAPPPPPPPPGAAPSVSGSGSGAVSVSVSALAHEQSKRLLDALHTVRALFDAALDENRQLRSSSGSNDAKVRRYMQELESVAVELRALEARHRRDKETYEAEVRRLRDEIDAVRHPTPSSSSITANGPPQRTQPLPYDPLPTSNPESAPP